MIGTVLIFCCRTPAPVIPTTPASFSRYCLVDVDSFPSPFSGELFGNSFVSLDPLPPSASTSMTPYQLGCTAEMPLTVADSGYQRDNRLLTLAAAGFSPRAMTTTSAVPMTAPSNTDNEVSSSCLSGVLMSDHQPMQRDEPDIARCASVLSLQQQTNPPD